MPTKKSTKTPSIKLVEEIKKKTPKVVKETTPKVFTVTYARGVNTKTFDDKATAVKYAEVTGGKVNEQ